MDDHDNCYGDVVHSMSAQGDEESRYWIEDREDNYTTAKTVEGVSVVASKFHID